jgi:hypothetical protein
MRLPPAPPVLMNPEAPGQSKPVEPTRQAASGASNPRDIRRQRRPPGTQSVQTPDGSGRGGRPQGNSPRSAG